MSTALTIGSGALQAYGSVSQGNSAKRAADQNASVLEQQAKNRYRQASLEEDRMRSSAAQIIGNQLAMGAQSGVSLSGSRLNELHESYKNVERDAATLRTSAAIDATGLENQARETRWQGKQAKKAGVLGAVMAGIGTASSLLSMTAGSGGNNATAGENAGASMGKTTGALFSVFDAAKTISSAANTSTPHFSPSQAQSLFGSTIYSGANSLLSRSRKTYGKTRYNK